MHPAIETTAEWGDLVAKASLDGDVEEGLRQKSAEKTPVKVTAKQTFE